MGEAMNNSVSSTYITITSNILLVSNVYSLQVSWNWLEVHEIAESTTSTFTIGSRT